MFTKHISDLEFSDIEYLVRVSKEPEGYHLDYKGQIGNPDNFKKVLSKEISSFGNTDGGYLIIGVEDKTMNIVGIEPTIMSRPVDEWFNQVLSTNIDPPVFYYDPKVIPIPESEKVIVVIHVPESSEKPHMVSETHQYFIRINDSSKPSTHNQVREMFDYSRRRYDEYQDFLQRRHILEVDDPLFGINNLNKHIYSEIPDSLKLPRPLVLFSIIPQYPYKEIINSSFRDLHKWLGDNSRGYEPDKLFQVIRTFGEYDIKVDGVVYKTMTGEFLSSYFEILNNGYIEVGFSNTVLTVKNSSSLGQHPVVYIIDLMGYLLILLGFSKKFYPFIKCFDEVVIQISFINVLNFSLDGINVGFGMRGRGSVNKHNNNFKVSYKYNPKNLSDSDISEIGKHLSEKICRGFGFETDQCFVMKEDKPILKIQNDLHI